MSGRRSLFPNAFAGAYASPADADWNLATTSDATKLERDTCLFRTNAHVNRPVVAIDIDPIGPTVLKGPSGERERRNTRDEKIDRSA